MNIRYRGSSENTGYKRFAEIQYAPKEEDNVNRFLLLIDDEARPYYGEDEVVTIEVDDKDDYNYIKELFKAYKKFDCEGHCKNLKKSIEKWRAGLMTDEGLYDKCRHDVDMYLILLNEGYEESEIKEIMYDVSCAPDAYNNAVIEFCELIRGE